jgi:glycosyltransferase involved in cell wall biosynthesis
LRIGIDALGLQSPQSRGRGIGRYGRSLVGAMASVADSAHEFVVYAYPGLEASSLPASERLTVRELPSLEPAGQAIEQVLRDDPDGLDVLLVTSPLEMYGAYNPPSRTLGGVRLAAVLYDLIPFLFQEQYLTWEPSTRRYYRSLERLRSYDLLLAISGATHDDARALLGVPASRIEVIDGAADTDFFHPAASVDEAAHEGLSRLGLDGSPFVFCLASTDRRKNVEGLLDGFAGLDPSVRDKYRLAVACALEAAEAVQIREWADVRGIGSNLVLTGEVSDEALRLCYQHCAAFAFPSRYEGFGLPILEAMACGAPVVAGDNSAQREVAGDSAELVRADEATSITAGLMRVLTDANRAAELRAKGRVRACAYSWDQTASRALRAIEALAPRRSARVRRGGDERPSLAVLSPLPRQLSGISNYTMELLPELARHFRMDLYHDEGLDPDLGRLAPRFSRVDHRLFERRDRVHGYTQVLSQMGNSHLHGEIYDHVLAWGGVVTLHDLYLGGFHWWRAQRGLTPPVDESVIAGYFRRQIERDEPGREAQAGSEVLPHVRTPDEFQRRLREGDLALHRSLIEAADAVVVHSQWARSRILRELPALADRVHAIPMGADPARPVSAAAREATRQAHGLPTGAKIIASFGILHSQKMNIEAIDAFAAAAQAHPDSLLVFVGPEQDGGAAHRHARELGLEPERVRFLGRVSDAAFGNLLGAVDVGINLRRPPTYGESSAALLHLLRHGIPTVVNAVDALAEVPDWASYRIATDDELRSRLASALGRLLSDAALRARLGAGSRTWVERECRWATVASRYARVLLDTPRRRFAGRHHLQGQCA